MRRIHYAMFLMGICLIGAGPLSAYLADGDIHLRMALLESDDHGHTMVLCESERIVLDTLSEQWTLTPEPTHSSAPSDISQNWICNVGNLSESADRMGDMCGLDAVSVSVVALMRPQMEDERVLEVTVTPKPKPDQCAERKETVSADPAVSRKIRFSDDAETYLPISTDWTGPDRQAERHLFVRLSTMRMPSSRRTKLGQMVVDAGPPGATVLVDGGAVGKLSNDGVLKVRFVRPGLHTVALRGPKHPDRLQFVRISPGRVHWLSFPTEDEKSNESLPFSLLEQGKNNLGFREFRRERDEAMMIEVPEGEFLMGNQRTERSPHEHKVYLSTFLIDKTGVTWGQYKRFAASKGIPLPPNEPYWGIHDNHPVVYVTRQEAADYCQWVGGRLPTEAEREKAARGTDGRMYPWGEREPAQELAVFRRTWANEATDPVGIRPEGASPYGALDMGGNVWEWCLDWYSDEYLESSPYRDPPGPESGLKYVVRGGSWDSRPDVTSASCRNWGHPGYREGDFGFRCAMNAPSN